MRIHGTSQIAAAFGVTVKTIAEWQKEGFPVAVHGKSHTKNEYDLPACIEWRVKREVGKVKPEDQRERVFRLQGDKLAREIAESQKLLIPVDLVEPKWRAACIAAREQLLRARRRLVERLGRCTTRQARDKAVAEVHDTFLRTLADWRSEREEDAA